MGQEEESKMLYEVETLKSCLTTLAYLDNSVRLRVITYLWEYFELDDYKREKQLAIQKQVKEASK